MVTEITDDYAREHLSDQEMGRIVSTYIANQYQGYRRVDELGDISKACMEDQAAFWMIVNLEAKYGTLDGVAAQLVNKWRNQNAAKLETYIVRDSLYEYNRERGAYSLCTVM